MVNPKILIEIEDIRQLEQKTERVKILYKEYITICDFTWYCKILKLYEALKMLLGIA